MDGAPFGSGISDPATWGGLAGLVSSCAKYSDRAGDRDRCGLQNHRGGDMIEVYKIFSGKYDTTVTNWLTGRHA